MIEPAFGIGRIVYCLLEHSYYVREGDENRAVLTLKPFVAPIKCCILPISQNVQFTPIVQKLSQILTSRGLSSKTDENGYLGRRYARTDELGIPFCLTIDFDTLNDHSVTLRERDSTNQIRINTQEVADVLCQLINEEMTWNDVYNMYPHQDQTQ